MGCWCLQNPANSTFSTRPPSTTWIPSSPCSSWASPLAEIHHILSLYRITDGENDDIREELLQLYQHQKEKCQQELAKLHDQVEGLNQKIRELTARQKGPARKVGVPLSMLGLIACPRCHKTLALSQVAMDTRYIYQAQLACPCGYKAHIHDGILMTENRYTDNDDTPRRPPAHVQGPASKHDQPCSSRPATS